jgi:hypothetical protein
VSGHVICVLGISVMYMCARDISHVICVLGISISVIRFIKSLLKINVLSMGDNKILMFLILYL